MLSTCPTQNAVMYKTYQRLFPLLLLTGVHFAQAATTTVADPSVSLLKDWRPFPESQNGQHVCNGEYFPPQFAAADQQQPIAIEADSGTLALTGKSRFSGNVLVQDQSNRIFADSIVLFRNSNTENIDWAEINGPLLIEQPGARLTGNFGKFIFEGQHISLQDSQFRLYNSHIRGHAKELTHALNTPYHFSGASYTTCEPNSNFWQLKAGEVAIDQKAGVGTAKHARLLIKDVPVLYSPYLTFPVGRQRQSGFLAPSYAISNNSGTTMNVPYYFNLAPNYDDTLTTSFLQKRGLLLNNEFRYLTPTHKGEFNVHLLPHDSEFAEFRDTTLKQQSHNLTDPRVKAVKRGDPTRGYLNFTDEGTYDVNWSSNIKYQYASDDNINSDLESRISNKNAWQLEQSASLHYELAEWQNTLQVQNFQTLQPYNSNINQEPYRLLPQFTSEATLPIMQSPLSFTVRSQYTRFAHATDIVTGHKPTTGDRLVFTPGLKYLYQQSYFYFQPEMHLENRLYRLNRDASSATASNDDENPHTTVPISSIKTGLMFERDGRYGALDYTQSLETQLFYQYSPYHNQDDLPVFDTSFSPITYTSYQRLNRFVGGDRIGDSNRLGYALISDYWEKATGEALGHWEFGQLVYFNDRRVSICNASLSPDCIRQEDPNFQRRYSNYFISGHWQADKVNDWQMNTELKNSDFSLRTLQLQWTRRLDDNHIVALGYLNSKELEYQNTNQVNGAFAWQLAPRWNILGRWYYDITEHVSIDAFAGIEYENCCWAMRLGKQRALKLNNARKTLYDDEIYFEFMLKGLSGYGDSHGKLAESVIPGYIDRFGQFKVKKDELQNP